MPWCSDTTQHKLPKSPSQGNSAPSTRPDRDWAAQFHAGGGELGETRRRVKAASERQSLQPCSGVSSWSPKPELTNISKSLGSKYQVFQCSVKLLVSILEDRKKGWGGQEKRGKMEQLNVVHNTVFLIWLPFPTAQQILHLLNLVKE